ncbi:MAG: extracellular solute-binding protein, partial [Chloroflexi bacterium]
MNDESRKMISRRQMLKLLGASAAGMVLAACSPQGGGETQPTSAPGQAATQPAAAPTEAGAVVTQPVTAPSANIETGKLVCMLCCGTDETRELQKQFNEYFTQTYPSIETALELPPAGQNYFEKLQTMFAAGTPPDVFDMWEGYVQPYAENGALMDLSPYIETSPWKMDDFQPA